MPHPAVRAAAGERGAAAVLARRMARRPRAGQFPDVQDGGGAQRQDDSRPRASRRAPAAGAAAVPREAGHAAPRQRTRRQARGWPPTRTPIARGPGNSRSIRTRTASRAKIEWCAANAVKSATFQAAAADRGRRRRQRRKADEVAEHEPAQRCGKERRAGPGKREVERIRRRL